MTATHQPPVWSPLSLLRERLLANLSALASQRPGLADLLRNFTPARQFYIQPAGDLLRIGFQAGESIHPLPATVPPAEARRVARQLLPSNAVTQPLLIIGEDQGWLWDSLYKAPCNVPVAPGHRPPLYCLVRDLERLWLMLHIQDWRAMLADERVRLFVGHDSFTQCRDALSSDPRIPWPRVAATVDPSLVPPGQSLDTMLAAAGAVTSSRQASIRAELSRHFDSLTPTDLADRFCGSQPLRVLGITSRYTTFLQYSMRDWLAAFRKLGHETEMVIERADHEVSGGPVCAEACARFKPDLILLIDHYRAEMDVLPKNVPAAMWVQDAMPHLFRPSAGQAQGPLDYALGFARLRMVHEFGYPADRYVPAVVGANEGRFKPEPLTAADVAKFGCDVAFVSHASASPESIIETEIERNGTPEARRALSAAFERVRAIYQAGGSIVEPIDLQRLLEQTLSDCNVGMTPAQLQAFVDLFSLRVNNALFRQQSLHWLADLGVDLRLYGKGWENHPKLSRFARGVAENEAQLPTIYRASKINLQITPHGAIHQRLIEGLCAGGFFLIRQVPGDMVERHYRSIREWCKSNSVNTDDELRDAAPPQIREELVAVGRLLSHDPFDLPHSLVESLESSEACGYIRSAGTVFGARYDDASYGSAEELRTKVSRYLTNDAARTETAADMRRMVLERFTYTATSQRLLAAIADNLRQKASASETPAIAA